MIRFRIDPYLIAILAVAGLASLLPVQGQGAILFGWATKAAIALLFFFHGAKLAPQAVVEGVLRWPLHIVIALFTFVVFPVLSLAFRTIPETLLPASLTGGLIFLACLPSTVQSSIAFTSIAKGDVPAAVTAASVSNLAGVFITPVLAAVFLGRQGGGLHWEQARDVALQLLLPFVLGQLLRPLIKRWVERHKSLIGYTDRGSILMVVYGAFSAAATTGLWKTLSPQSLLVLTGACALLLAVVLALSLMAGRLLGFDKPARITLLFCGSKKSLASGAPMAGVLFPAASVGVMVLPLMIFHQLQLLACAVIAARYARESSSP
jgi:solute carrier family 10 (sodium/bile acid cotransporter), member 7